MQRCCTHFCDSRWRHLQALCKGAELGTAIWRESPAPPIAPPLGPRPLPLTTLDKAALPRPGRRACVLKADLPLQRPFRPYISGQSSPLLLSSAPSRSIGSTHGRRTAAGNQLGWVGNSIFAKNASPLSSHENTSDKPRWRRSAKQLTSDLQK